MFTFREPPYASRNGYVPESLVVGASVFLLFAAGACASIYVGDGDKSVTAVHTLGISQPSGYPLYILAGKLDQAWLQTGVRKRALFRAQRARRSALGK